MVSFVRYQKRQKTDSHIFKPYVLLPGHTQQINYLASVEIISAEQIKNAPSGAFFILLEAEHLVRNI